MTTSPNPEKQTTSGGSAPDPLLVSIPDAARMLSVGRTSIYHMLADGRLQSLKLGSRNLVTTASIRALVDRLMNESSDEAA